MKKDGKRTEPLLLGICVCIFIPSPGDMTAAVFMFVQEKDIN